MALYSHVVHGAEYWWQSATSLYEANNYSAAARAFSRFIALQPTDGTAHLMLALCQYQLGLDDAAIENIEAAKKYGIRKDDALRNVLQYHQAMLQLRKGQFESAHGTLAYLVRESVESDDLYFALGMSVLLLRPADELSHRDVVLRTGQAESLSLLKKPAEARSAYSDLTSQFPDFPNLHFAYGRFLLDIRDPDAAVVEFQREIKNNPRHARARLQIAAIRYRIDSAEGLKYATEAVALDPSLPFGHYLLGLLSLDTGDNLAAIRELEIARPAFTKLPDFYVALGNAYARAGRKEEAARARAVFAQLSGSSARE